MAPCCRSWSVAANSIDEYWNHPNIQELRADMLAGKKNKRCEFCYQREESGFSSLRLEAAHVDINAELAKTSPDGHHLVNLVSAEVRLSNLCNFKCRTCNGASSFAIAVETDEKQPIKYALNSRTQLVDELKLHKDTMKVMRFSGGEPLMHQEHWDLLEYFIEQGRTDMVLGYNTNGSIVTFKNKSIFEIWKHFAGIEVTMSLDAAGIKGEYWRNGTVWPKVVDNIIEMINNGVNVGIHITVSWVNALSILELVSALDMLNIQMHSISFSPVMNVFMLQSAPAETKVLIAEHFNKISTTYPGLAPHSRMIIDHMNKSPPNSTAFYEDIERIKKFDLLRRESFARIFPEHKHNMICIKPLWR